MNAPDKLAQFIRLTREPLPASTKRYLQGSRPDIQVPLREILQSNGEAITVYDTSGPYTDPSAAIDVRRGLPDLRGPWLDARGDTEAYTGRRPQALDDGDKHGGRGGRQRLARLVQDLAQVAPCRRLRVHFRGRPQPSVLE